MIKFKLYNLILFILANIAIQRMRDYIRFVNGEIPMKPVMATMLDSDLEIDQLIMPSIIELLREVQKLSENIYQTEIEIQSIDKLLKLLDEYKRDNEKYMKQLSVSTSIIKMWR